MSANPSIESTPRGTIRVMLVNESKILLREVVDFLFHQPDVELVGSVYVIANVLDHVQRLAPDVVLLDITLQGAQALPIIDTLHDFRPTLPIIVLDEISEESVVRSLRSKAATSFIVKTDVTMRLIPAILAAVQSA